MRRNDWKFTSSSFCTVGTCVEVALGADGAVAVRDSKNPEAALIFNADEWAAFVRGVKAGEFDPM